MTNRLPLSRRAVLAGATALAAVSAVQAQPDLSRPMGATIADTGSAHYRFDRFDIWSRDGRRHYRITVGIPNRPAPAAGYPALYMLDGNAALGEMTEPLLAEMDQAGPPVLVAIGYATDRRFDVEARAFDYTPPVSAAGETWENKERGRPGGGADLFLDLIDQEIKPRVARRAAIDPARTAIWGHSYGGLFVLHALFTRPAGFRTYIAASPSLWWQDGFVLGEEKRFAGAPARLLVTRGTAEGERRDRPGPGQGPGPGGGRKPPPGRDNFPPDAAPDLVERLRGRGGLHVEFVEFAGLSHGQALSASLPPALRFVVAPV